MRYLGTLLERPGLEIPAVELCGGTAVEAVAHDLLDRESLVAYRRRVAELDAEIERAEAVGDTTRVSVLIDERDALRSELATVLAVSGRSRRFVDASERARTAVRKPITRALAAIAAADGTIASELRASISTGHTCSYRPGPDDPRRWTVSDS